jgi:hypothetical protein
MDDKVEISCGFFWIMIQNLVLQVYQQGVGRTLLTLAVVAVVQVRIICKTKSLYHVTVRERPRKKETTKNNEKASLKKRQKKGSHRQNTNVIVPFHPTFGERHFSIRLVLPIVPCWFRRNVIVVFLLLVLPD